jgi:hypothetical protein
MGTGVTHDWKAEEIDRKPGHTGKNARTKSACRPGVAVSQITSGGRNPRAVPRQSQKRKKPREEEISSLDSRVLL